jgi:hypothetical protein
MELGVAIILGIPTSEEISNGFLSTEHRKKNDI